MFDSLVSVRQRIKTDDMTMHGAVMVTFGMLAGFFNYLYQLSMGILLTPEQYGVLFSLTSLLIIIIVFSRAITITIAKFTSKLKAEGRLGGINYLWHFSLKRTFLIGVAAFLLLAALSPLVCRFLNMDTVLYPIILFSAMLVVLALSVNWGTMQGLQRFLPLGSSQALVGFLKVALGALFVYLGLGICGGLAAIPISFAVVLLLTFLPLRNLSRAGNERIAVGGLRSYAGLTLLAIFCITMLTNVDVVLARHYLSATDAGNYSAISVLGRIAFYAPVGVSLAMFPKTSELFERGGDYRRLFLKAILLTLVIAGGVVLVYSLFPQLVTKFLFNGKYPLIAPYLFIYGLAMALFALSFLVMNYFLSLNQTKVAYPLLGAMLIQFILIALFHSSIAQLVSIMLICGILSIFSMIPFYLKVRQWKFQ